MTEHAPPTPPNPAAAAKGLKGHLKGRSKLVYVAMAVGVITIAYIVHRRNQAAAAAAAASPTAPPAPDPTSVPPDTASYAGQGVFAGPSQGAFGGFPDPGSFIPSDATDPASAQNTPATVVNVYGATPDTSTQTPPDSAIPDTPAPAVTGGGMPNRSVAAHRNPIIQRASAAHGGALWDYRVGTSGKLVPVRQATQHKSTAHTPAPQHSAAHQVKKRLTRKRRGVHV